MRLPGKRNSNPLPQGQSAKIISTIEWIRTSRLSIRNSLSCTTRHLQRTISSRLKRLVPPLVYPYEANPAVESTFAGGSM